MQERRRVKADFVGHLREDWFLQKELYDNYSGITLSQHTYPNNGKTVYRNDDYFNWVYYVPSGVVGVTYPPVIYDGGVPVNSANYTIHYAMGEVSFSVAPTGVVTADFAMLRYYVSEADDPLFDREDARFSYVVIQSLGCPEEGLQLGGGVLQNWGFVIELGSYHRTSPQIARARTDDLVELIKRGLNIVPVLDYTISLPLDADGDRISAYNRVTQRLGYYTLYENRVVDVDIPNYDDSREIARHSLSFTMSGAADTTAVI